MSGRDPQTMSIFRRTARRRPKYRALFAQAIEHPAHGCDYVLASEHPDELVDLGIFLHQPIFFSFGQATGYDHSANSAPCFQFEHFLDGPMRFFPGVGNEPAGVYYNEIGARGLLYQSITVQAQQARHALGIDQILRTSKTDKGVTAFGGIFHHDNDHITPSGKK
jgi:hypothetical protein